MIVPDQGIGQGSALSTAGSTGLGITIANAIAKQFEAGVEQHTDADGLNLSLIRATFASHLRNAAYCGMPPV